VPTTRFFMEPSTGVAGVGALLGSAGRRGFGAAGLGAGMENGSIRTNCRRPQHRACSFGHWSLPSRQKCRKARSWSKALWNITRGGNFAGTNWLVSIAPESRRGAG